MKAAFEKAALKCRKEGRKWWEREEERETDYLLRMESCPVLKRIRKWIWKCKLGPPNENLKGLKRLNNNTYLRGNKVLKQDSEWKDEKEEWIP